MPIYTFEPFELDPEARVLRRNGDSVPMAAKTLDMLVLLVQNRGRLVEKDELLSRVWAGSVVEEANLTQNIFTLRKILGDSPKDHRYIATVAGRGYQFVAPVAETTQQPQRRAAVTSLKRSWAPPALAFALFALLAAGMAWFGLHWPSKRGSELSQERVTFNSSTRTVVSAAISPNGRYVAYSESGGIHIKLLSTGEERIIRLAGEAPAGTITYVDSWFPDGAQVLGHSVEIDGRTNIWIASLIGDFQRKLRPDGISWQVSPDGTEIAFSPGRALSHARELWLMNADGGNARKILDLGETGWLWSVKWSPDGRRLAYIRAQHPLDEYPQTIESCDRQGMNRAALLAVPEGNPLVRGEFIWLRPWLRDIAWLRDGRVIYSRGESRSNDANLWEISASAKNGSSARLPKRLTNWAGSNVVGLTASADGTRMMLRKETRQGQVWLGELASSGNLKSLPRRLAIDEANDIATAWTGDSRAVILESDLYGKPGIFKQPINSQTPEPLVVGPRPAWLPRLSPDGTSVVYWEEAATPTAHEHNARLMRVSVNGGPPQMVLERSIGTGDLQCSRAPANLCVISETSPDGKSRFLTAFNPYGGGGKLIKEITLRAGANYQEGISPDGSTFAVVRVGQVDPPIRLVSLSGGSDREITVKGRPNVTSLDWSPDGKGFYCGSTSPEGAVLNYVDLEGTAHMVWRDREARWDHCLGMPSPDNRHLAIIGLVHNSNVWMIDNF